MGEPKYRRPLNPNQIAILNELYRFRIATTQLLVDSLGAKDIVIMNRKLNVLLDQGLINRHFEPNYRLSHKHASYFLTSAGANYLKAIPNNPYSQRVLRNIKRVTNPSDKFIDRSTGVYSICNYLRTRYGDGLRIFTKSELADFEYFPDPRPDAYIRYKVNNEEQQFILEYIDLGMPLKVAIGRIRGYIKYCDEGEWEVTNSPLPPILLVFSSTKSERRFHKYALPALDESDEEELRFYSTSIDSLKEFNNHPWTSLQDIDVSYELKDVTLDKPES